MRVIKTADGKTYEVRTCATIPQGPINVLFIEFIDQDMLDIVTEFYKETTTSVIYEYVDDVPNKTLYGFTRLTDARIVDTHNVSIRLETVNINNE